MVMIVNWVIRIVGESTKTVGANVGRESSGNKMPTLDEYRTSLTKLEEEVDTMTLFHTFHSL